MAGEALWAAVYVGAGFAFGRAWSQVVDVLGNGAGLLGGLVIAAAAIVVGANVAGIRLPSRRARKGKR